MLDMSTCTLIIYDVDVSCGQEILFSSEKNILAIVNPIPGCGHLYSYQLSYDLHVIIFLRAYV
jgi:hypothetical protein